MNESTGVVHRHLDDRATVVPVLDLVVPVYNEAHVVAPSVERLHRYLTSQFPFSWRITIVDNASTDGTWFEAMRLARDLTHVRALHLDKKGRGLALRTAWRESDAEVVAYTDVDLSTDLGALLPLIAPLVSRHSDVAIGSRLSVGASVARRPKREFISRSYNLFLRFAFATRVRDAQCGFKAVRADVARALLPAIGDDGWFFDTELLLLAERNGLRIHEVPVDWVDDADSRVKVVSTALGDLRGSLRIAREFLRGRGFVDLGANARVPVDDDFGRRLVTFAAIGAASTAVSLALFLFWRGAFGPVGANAAAVTATFFANTWLHARVTARLHRPRWLGATAVYAASIALTSIALVAVHGAGLGLPAELVALGLTWTAATIARLLFLGRTRPQHARACERCHRMTGVLDDQLDLETLLVDDEPAVRPRSSLGRLWRGPEHDPSYARPALILLLGATAALYLWGLGASGWANSYYAMAVQAATKSWKAFFFGSLDAGNSITVDKPPASLWVMDISARIFGMNAWSMLVPQALEGVVAVGVLYATVKRWFGPAAALLAGAVMALTPVGALMFRYNNPDALLVLLLVAGAYALTRAIERGSTKWLMFSFGLVGFGFLAKELQALVVVPAFGLAYLLAGPPHLARRIGQLALGAAALLASAGWWVAIVQLWPASSRPYIGGSQTNSLWNVIFGYNGFGRLTGNETGSVGGAPGGTGQWGPTGLTRLFNASFGGDASWLLPAALILLAAGLLFTISMPRTDRTRSALVLWGGWLVITGLAFSLGQGIIHPYYTVALAPAIGAIVGIGATRLWNGRAHPAARVILATAFAATAWWSYTLLKRTPHWHPELRAFVALGGVVGTVLIAIRARPVMRRGAVALATGALVITLAGPAAYTLSTASTPHTGAIPSAGPAAAAALSGPGGFGGPGARGFGRFPGGGGNGMFTPPNFGNGNGTFTPPNFANGNGPGGFSPPTNGFGGAGRGGIGGLLNGSAPSATVTNFLKSGASGYRWVAATVGANNAAGYQIASGAPVMSLGGFNGTDPAPTLAQFQNDVAKREIHYYLVGRGGFGAPGGGGSSTVSAITQWVENNFTAHTIGNVTYYDLTGS